MWVATIELGRDHKGRRRRRVVYGRTKREALIKLEQARMDKHQNLEPMDLRLTTGEWLDTWLSEHSAELSPGSRITYRRTVETYVRPAVGHIRLAKLTPADVERMGRELRERGLSAGPPRTPTEYSGPHCRWPSGTGWFTATSQQSPQDRSVTIAPRLTTRCLAKEADAVIAAAHSDRLGALAIVC